MKLIVGLGNPGRKYYGTRHNIGFEVLAEVANRYGQTRPQSKFQGEMVDADLAGCPVRLLCPHTYMNRSGQSVRQAMDFFKLDVVNVLIVCDDFNLPLAKLRFRSKGSSGGQKGLEDIIRHLGTSEVPRLRIGIGEVPERWLAPDFVLSRYSPQERTTMDDVIRQAAQGLVDWADQGIEFCMNQYN